MRRYHLIELHEAPWFPPLWRRLFLDGLGYTITHLGMYRNAAEPFARLLNKLQTREVLDLCSGSAEPILQLCRGVSAYGITPPKIVLSDLYPNVSQFQVLKNKYTDAIDYCRQSVNAMHVPQTNSLPRVRTMLSALHHFTPEQVRDILRDAAMHSDGLVVLECTTRSWKNVAHIAITAPFSAAIITAFLLRPWRLRNLFYSLVVPVMPLTALVDSVVSSLRTYTVDELQAIIDDLGVDDFAWEVGTVAVPDTKLYSSYIIGWRKSAVKADAAS